MIFFFSLSKMFKSYFKQSENKNAEEITFKENSLKEIGSEIFIGDKEIIETNYK